MIVKNKAATALGRKRWALIPKEERAQLVPKNGGRKRLYPVCPSGKPHRFEENVCKFCGFNRPELLPKN